MNKTLIAKTVPVLAAILAGVAILCWFFGSDGAGLKERMPGEDRAEGEATAVGGSTKWEGRLVGTKSCPSLMLVS